MNVLLTHQHVLPVGMVKIVPKNVDKTASPAVTGLMESVNLAVNLDGKDLTVTRVMTLLIVYSRMHY